MSMTLSIKEKRALYWQKWYNKNKNKEKVLNTSREWYKANKQRQRINGYNWFKTHPQIIQNSRMKTRYNITQEEYYEIHESQNNCCAICGKHESKLRRKLNIDHDHKTGLVRGLLCDPCNQGIGKFYDNITFLFNAIDYLNKSK